MSTLDEPELRPVIESFVRTLFARLQEMLADCSQNNFDALADHAHWLKGAGGTVGFGDFTEPAARLDTLANSGATDLIAQTLQELVEIAEAIRLDNTDEPVLNPV